MHAFVHTYMSNMYTHTWHIHIRTSQVGLQKEVSPQPEQKRSQEGEELVGEEQQPLVKGPDRALSEYTP